MPSPCRSRGRISDEFTSRGDRVLDPFCGSGTLLVEGVLMGRQVVGHDVDPLAVFISEVKTRPLDAVALQGTLDRILAANDRPRGGFFSWLTLPLDGGELALRAVEAGVAVVPGSLFFPDGRGGTNVRLSFSNVADELIDTGIERLAALVQPA